MNPDKTSWAPRDGLAFGLEKEGGSAELAGRLESELKKDITLFKRSRRYRDQDIPWFWTVDIPRKEDGRLITWVMEYDPVFLDRWSPDLPPGRPGEERAGEERAGEERAGEERPGIARRGVLTRYRSAIGDDLPDRLFRDITSVTVTLPPTEADLLEAELQVYGYVAEGIDVAVDSRKGGADPGDGDQPGAESTTSSDRKRFRGPDLEIVVEWASPDDDRDGSRSDRDGPGSNRDGSGQVGTAGGIGGITAFTMETQPVSVTTTHTFGPACRLTVDRTGKATWFFQSRL